MVSLMLTHTQTNSKLFSINKKHPKQRKLPEIKLENESRKKIVIKIMMMKRKRKKKKISIMKKNQKIKKIHSTESD